MITLQRPSVSSRRAHFVKAGKGEGEGGPIRDRRVGVEAGPPQRCSASAASPRHGQCNAPPAKGGGVSFTHGPLRWTSALL